MLTHKVSAYKLVTAMIALMRNDEEKPRMSLLDMAVILTINSNPHIGKNGLLEIMDGGPNGGDVSHSYLDRPIARLLMYGLLSKKITSEATTKLGDPRTTYALTKKGTKFLEQCSHAD